ncbi:hypothetical protein F1188_18070 [Roseospira marina]|uniref:Uncharacterized protein n=1 Tax=Roseospira marina TaxID=140057 RepID=A0A5M6I729_9PROT|nr:hypothetical protein [Roseospira marina]KAA5604006.1 hypothetical protein F1188_18070 [Roseospira marina]MBB4315891.1 hypothetical protein [Roseospira marina]MBB5089063.1 hypothetical protein [Roseospira marina]
MERQQIDTAHLDTDTPITDAEMRCAGVTRVSTDVFHYREYKYTNLKDAMAQAKRDADEKNR